MKFFPFGLAFLVLSPGFFPDLSAKNVAEACQPFIVRAIPLHDWMQQRLADPIYLQVKTLPIPEEDVDGNDVFPEFRPAGFTRVEYWKKPGLDQDQLQFQPEEADRDQYFLRYFGPRAGRDVVKEILDKGRTSSWSIDPGKWSFRPPGMDKHVHVGLESIDLLARSDVAALKIQVVTFRDHKCQPWSRVIIVAQAQKPKI